MSLKPIDFPWDGPEPATVAEILRHHARRTPDRLAYRFLTGLDGGAESWTYRDLDLRARSIAGRLQREGQRSRPVLLLLPPGLEYVAGFLGCLYAGAIAVPAYPPDAGRSDQTMARLAAIARDARAGWALVDEEQKRLVEAAPDAPGGLDGQNMRWLPTTDCGPADAETYRDPGAAPGALAFLQYTSGSTATPKGVMVSNENLVANLRAIHVMTRHDRDSAVVSWLPPYHDMGLIGGILMPLYAGIPAHLMAPRTFVQRPFLWLDTISRTRATTSPAPNFGFDYCLRRVTPEQRAELDLSGWRLALNGAEPVRADTLDRFADAFSPCGFDRSALLPCYGLAEATLLVSGTDADRPPLIGTFGTEALEAGQAVPAEPAEPVEHAERAEHPEETGPGRRTTRVVGCGPAADRVGVAIVDPQSRRRLPPGRIGEVWVSGPGVARGYWRDPEATRDTFQASIEDGDGTAFLRTGDLGFEHGGELHLVSRLKDLVIVQGRNHYPQDVERTVEETDEAIRPGGGAAFGVEIDGAEELVVVYEVDAHRVGDGGGLLARLRTAIAQAHEVSPHAIVLVKRSAVPKTTSGKIQRQGCKRAFLSLGLPVLAASVLRDDASAEPEGRPHRPAPRPEPRPEPRPDPGTVERRIVDALAGAAGVTEFNGRDLADAGLGYVRLVRVVRRLERELGVSAPLGELLADPTVGHLKEMFGAGQPNDAPTPAPVPAPASAQAPAPGRRAAEIEAWLTAGVADRLGLPARSIDATAPFAALGLDSKTAVAIVGELGAWLGRPLTPGTVFERPTIRDVAAWLGGDGTAPEPSPPPLSSPSPALGAEPIAVIGLGCRFPGAPDPQGYWRLLLDGRDAVGEVPADRWDAAGVDAPGRGGFIEHIDRFDARFFGISAREAERMDPQQRLLMEVAWQTFEDAGIVPDDLAGTGAGVFVGISSHDYADLQAGGGPCGSADVFTATGTAHAIAANRLSYHFDLRGPSLAVDTACSSSLAAVHMACRSLRDGECGVALAGGVNLLINPALSVAFARGGMLSPDGLCKTFDDTASGYVRGEGAGLVLLKPLSQAVADGDRVYATISGSAVGHGGRSNGLTAPKGSAQRQVIERALAEAGTDGGGIAYVEAHGTGTELGDPVEWETLAAVYGGNGERDGRCPVGSVKANIGHLEAAAGIAGLIKAVLAVHHGEIPPQLHFSTPNRHLAWEGSGLTVATDRRELPPGRTARIGVSSFGFGGANAHVIVEQAAQEKTAREQALREKTVREKTAGAPWTARPVQALCLSGHTPTALATLARRYRAHLAAHPDEDLADLCHAANTRRARLAHRAVITARSRQQLDEALSALAGDEASTDVIRGESAGRGVPQVAFLFSGQGTQYPGMGRRLLEGSAAFARVIEESDEVLGPLLGLSLRDLVFRDDDDTGRLRRTRYCQPALVALEIALAELWTSAGVRPAAVLGHSAGAFGAACVAGALTLEQALTLAAARGRLMDEQPGPGTMIACSGDAETIRRAAAATPSVAVAAVNGPAHLVLSGPPGALDELAPRLRDGGITVRPLAVSHAFHSPMMAGAAEPLRAVARTIEAGEPEIPWISDATGEPMGRPDPGYWARHLLGTVRFADGFATLRGLGCDAFVEIGPHPTLIGLARAAAQGTCEDVLWLPSLRRGGDDWETLLRSLGRLDCAGGDVRWGALDDGRPAEPIAVPHAVFERRSYWFGERAPAGHAPAATPPPVPRQPDEPRERRTEIDVTTNGHPRTDEADEAVARILSTVSRVSGFPRDQIPAHARLSGDLGFDSLMKGELERHLAPLYPDRVEELRTTLPEDFTVRELIDALGASSGPGNGAAPVPRMAPVAATFDAQPEPSAPPAPAPSAPEPSAPAPLTAQPAPVAPAKPNRAIERRFEDWEEYAELQERLRLIESSGPNAYERLHDGFNSGLISMDGRRVVNFSAFNYLALSAHPRLRAAAKDAIDRYGTSSSATPLLCGETPLHRELEAEIAAFLGTEDAIVFAGGHATNVATVGHLFGPEDLVLHDEWIHDSTVRGTILSGARRRPFPHNDWRALDRVLGAMRGEYRRAVVVIEGAYSQDGDLPDLPRFVEVKRRHDAMLMIDEAHSLGVLGRTGRGIGEHFGVGPDEVDLWMGTLSKAIGSLGGYIAARRPLIQYLKYTTPLYIFSTGISPANAAAALEAFRVIRDEPERVVRLRALSEHFRAAARARGLDIGVSQGTAVIPVIVGDWGRAMEVSSALLARGVNVMPIGYPAVPKDKCRLRFFVNADHREADLDRSLDLLVDAMDTDPDDGRTRPAASPTRPAASRSGASKAPGFADVLVAGAGGFIGGHLTRRLVELGHQVRVLVREGSDRSALDGLPVEVAVGSLTDLDALLRATSGVRHVYNCAGKSADWGAWEEFEQVNVHGCRNLVDAAHHAGTVERFLHVSTTDVYGYPVRPCGEGTEPRDIGLPYNRSKLLGERAVARAAERAGLPLTIVRPVSVYGPRSKDFVVEIASLLLQRQMVYVRKGMAPAGLLYVANAVDAMIAACGAEGAAGGVYNLRDPEMTTWREYIEALAAGLGVRPPSVSLPRPLATGVAGAAEKIYGTLRVRSRPPLTRHAVHLMERDQSYPIDRARDEFGFKSEVSFEEGMGRTIEWLNSPEGREHVGR
ncbi:aminotransferase class I/II-fold pyridoxal phosphate-dependent enzyme [Actinomadura rubrisoli]|uniref:Aminotransferase class I/II-fold pyridoxal phosphate-dependent enzyme n=2 Tax=Actinomadura rubrisoli TaxID=2530368 RepID=A0A4R5BHY7_9ACTN|nr:aminotransferase class I/II-fold pyridoxal phosphate-dependent enzyme [Actinomadura rubrisoli]